jgi:predicted dehydrogenase
MASKLRYTADSQSARQVIESGRLGALGGVEIVFSGTLDPAGTWRADPIQAGGGVIADNGPHVADLARFLLGPVEAVRAAAPSSDRRERSASLEMRCGDTPVRAELSWERRLDAPYLRVHGDAGALELDWPGGSITNASGARPFGAGYDKLAALRANLVDVAGSIGDGRQTQATAMDAAASVDVLSAFYASLTGGGWVEVPSPIGLPS